MGTINKDEITRKTAVNSSPRGRRLRKHKPIPPSKRVGPKEELILPKPGQTITYLEWRGKKNKATGSLRGVKDLKLKAVVKAKPIRQDGAWEILFDCPDGTEHWAWWDKTRRAWISGDI
jgi:hypothetical protein